MSAGVALLENDSKVYQRDILESKESLPNIIYSSSQLFILCLPHLSNILSKDWTAGLLCSSIWVALS